MGKIFSRSRHDDPGEALDRLEAHVKNIERDSRNKQIRYKRISDCCLTLFVVFYCVCLILYIATGIEFEWLVGLLCAMVLFIIVPILFLFIRKAIHVYYIRALRSNKIHLAEKKEEKFRLLEKVKNTAVYKVAKEILNKHGKPDREQLQPLMNNCDD